MILIGKELIPWRYQTYVGCYEGSLFFAPLSSRAINKLFNVFSVEFHCPASMKVVVKLGTLWINKFPSIF